MRARLVNDGYGSGWPWPASGSTDPARGLLEKMSFSHRNFAALRFRVSPLPRPDWPLSTIVPQAIQPALTT